MRLHAVPHARVNQLTSPLMSHCCCLQMRGTVSMRTWLIIAYLTVLHFALMASFTRRGGALTAYDLEELCAGSRGAHRLPGT